MQTHSIKARLIVTILLLEFLAALALTGLAVLFQEHVRMRAFDLALQAKAASLFGAVGDADDPADNIVLDLHGISIPADDLFDVEAADGRVLGRSADWRSSGVDRQVPGSAGDGIYRVILHRHGYRLVVLHAVRVVDPGEKGGGARRPVTVRYAASTAHVWSEVIEAVRFYSIASLLLLMATGGAMAWILRRSLAPLAELAGEASRISGQQWQFHAPESARAVTELAPLTAALESALGRLQRSFEQQRRFTSDAAHELKTDVAIAKSSLQLLAMKPRTTEDYAQGLETCITDTLRLERTVAEMLTLARVEHGGVDVSSTAALDLSLCLRNVVGQFETFAELRRVHVDVSAADSVLAAVYEEDGRILCSNLLLNALQHSRPNSTVSVRLAGEGGSAVLVVRDHGAGIAPEALPHVFEPFFRGDSSRNRKTGGTGLGLAICKGICDKAGGRIEISSETGAGTQVTATLPRRERAAEPIPSAVLNLHLTD